MFTRVCKIEIMYIFIDKRADTQIKLRDWPPGYPSIK